MATQVENPFDTQQAKPQNAGLIAGVQSTGPAYTPVTPSVSRSTDTTQGQLDSILSGDSPLMQRARTIAAQQANSRGLLNSSMAAEAGTAAMIDRATPIAASDSAVYDTRARFNADAQNQSLSQGANISAQMGLQREQQEFQRGESSLERTHQTQLQTQLQEGQQNFQRGESALDRAQQVTLQTMQADAQRVLQESQQTFQQMQSQLDREHQTALTHLQATLQEQINIRGLPQQFAANLSASAMNAIQAILVNADLTPDSKKNAIANVIDAANSQLAWGSTFYNTPLPSMSTPTEAGSQAQTAAQTRTPNQVPSYLPVGTTLERVHPRASGGGFEYIVKDANGNRIGTLTRDGRYVPDGA